LSFPLFHEHIGSQLPTIFLDTPSFHPEDTLHITGFSKTVNGTAYLKNALPIKKYIKAIEFGRLHEYEHPLT